MQVWLQSCSNKFSGLYEGMKPPGHFRFLADASKELMLIFFPPVTGWQVVRGRTKEFTMVRL